MKSKFILLIALLAAGAARGATEVDIDSLRYMLNDDGSATVKSCLYQGTPNIIIPQTVTVEGMTYQVKSIGSNVFGGKRFITSVQLPDGLQAIGSNAFNDCSSLTSVNIPSAVTSIGSSSFYNCKQLGGDITLPATLTSLGTYAFSHCEAVKNVTFLGDGDVTLQGDDEDRGDRDDGDDVDGHRDAHDDRLGRLRDFGPGSRIRPRRRGHLSPERQLVVSDLPSLLRPRSILP